MTFLKKFTHSLTAALVITLLASMAPHNASAEDNGLERTPVLGWSSWSFLRKLPTADKMKAQALALHNSGLQKLGYEYVNLDDFWYQCPGPQGPNVDNYGRWITDPSIFPPQGDSDGIKVVADYVHSLGMKFGIYVTPGISKQAVSRKTQIKGTSYTADQIAEPSVKENNYNCKGMVRVDYTKPGAQEYTNSWLEMLASWGIDYIKIDGMQDSNAPDVKAWSNAIRKSGRPMVLDVTQGSYTSALTPTLMKYANQWEFAPDIECYRCEKGGSSYPLTSWADISNRFDYVAKWQPYAGPGGFNDYDSIEIGNGSNDGLTADERQMQISLWALGASPLILGVDLTQLDQSDVQKYLQNSAVLAVDQDSIAAKRVLKTGNHQVFAKKESNGDVIVGLFNTGAKTEKISVPISTVGLSENKNGYSLNDLWTGETTKTNSIISASVPSHGVLLYRVKGL
ncbi:MAG TPA: glycoside hydrolase family 27 protein [Candidatus Binataceae bacterium]|nr:glycoside hydrolase family 27 protein [Candidatus Binataceae bacterium]